MNDADVNGMKIMTIIQHSKELDGPMRVLTGPPTFKDPKHISFFFFFLLYFILFFLFQPSLKK